MSVRHLGQPVVLFATIVFTALTVAAAEPPHHLSSHEKTARELYRALGGAKTAEAGAEAMMGIVTSNPELAPYQDVFRAWYKKVFAGDELEEEMAAIYMKAFTEEELKGLMAFYATPLGIKALQKFPELMKQGAEIGMSRAQKHSAELEEMIATARKEREKKTPNKP